MSLLIETERAPLEPLKFPKERAAVKVIQDSSPTFLGVETVEWALENNLITPGDILCAEVNPTLRCPEACPGCPDSSIELEKDIKTGLKPKIEPRASADVINERVDYLIGLGVEHLMYIGGTVDSLSDLDEMMLHAKKQESVRVSWFSDGIPQTNTDGTPSRLMQKKLDAGWLTEVYTHVSFDYPFAGKEDLYTDFPSLPSKIGRVNDFAVDAEKSREFKSQYGVAFAKNLIDNNARRVVLNTTVSPSNLPHLPNIYLQALDLEKYAKRQNSKTEVMWTFSPWVWRPHQARGDGTKQSPASSGLQLEHMEKVNDIFGHILDNEYLRLLEGKDRLLANSSAYTNLMVDPKHAQRTVDQDTPYKGGIPEMYDISPTGEIWCDPMFPGPELAAVSHTFGYRDREPRYDKNPFTMFQDEREWFPNIIST